MATDDEDSGAFTLIVAHEDPNIDGRFREWIQTVGHEFSTIFRWVVNVRIAISHTAELCSLDALMR